LSLLKELAKQCEKYADEIDGNLTAGKVPSKERIQAIDAMFFWDGEARIYKLLFFLGVD